MDHEALGSEVRRLARLRDDEVMPAEKIARRLLGPGSVIKMKVQSALAMLVPFKDSYIVTLNPKAPDGNWLVGHELGHWAMITLAKRPQHTEEDANRVAAAILSPAGLVVRLHDAFGEQLAPIARALDLSQTSVMLRIGVVRSEERAVVAPSHVRAISFGGFAKEPEPVLREYVEHPPKGVKRLRLSGAYDKGRYGLAAAA